MATRIQQLLTAALVLSLSLLSSECRAEPHTRDGFYLQLASGVGWMNYSSTAHAPYYTFAPARDYQNQQSGPGMTGSLLLGFPLRPGLALGVGGLGYAHALSHPHRTSNGQIVTREDNGGPYLKLMGAVGPFIDYYPSAAFGWHVQALVGYANLWYGENAEGPSRGVGLMAGVGHDWWVSDHWSIGTLTRLVYVNTYVAGVQYPEGGGMPSEHDSVLAPSLEASFTYH